MRSSTLKNSDHDICTPQQFLLTATGITPIYTLSLHDALPIYQQMGTPSTPQAVTLSNTGNEPMAISSITITGTNSGDFARTSNCPLSPATLAVNTRSAHN